MDEDLNFSKYIKLISKSGIFITRDFAGKKKGMDMFDYCNGHLTGIRKTFTGQFIQLIQSVAARVLTKTKKRDNTSQLPSLSSLYWLPVQCRIADIKRVGT